MKKIIAVWMAALMLLAMAACTVKKDNQDQGHTSDQKLPNPFEDVASLEEAEKAGSSPHPQGSGQRGYQRGLQ